MTSEQIAELRRIASGYAKDEERTDARERETPLAVLASRAIRLLDEREALLAALRAWMPSADDEPEDPNWHHVNERGEHFFMDGYSGGADPGECPVCLSRAAIAKAEAP